MACSKDKPTMTNHTDQDAPTVTRPRLVFDVERYQKMLDKSDLTEAEKTAFLETLWSVVVGLVDLGFEIHPLQQSGSEACGQDLDLSAFMASGVISSNKTIAQNNFTHAADPIDGPTAERKES